MHPVQATKVYTTYACGEGNGWKKYDRIETTRSTWYSFAYIREVHGLHPDYMTTYDDGLGKKNNFCLCAYYYALHCIHIHIHLHLLPVSSLTRWRGGGVVRLHCLLLHAPYILLSSRLYPGPEVGGRVWDMTEWLNAWMPATPLDIHTTIFGSIRWDKTDS